MNARLSEALSRVVHPVVQFVLLIVPVVMNGFFAVYALSGWVIDGRDKLNWSLEALDVARWTGLGIVGFAVLVVAYVRLVGGGWRHPLIVSSGAHALFALLLGVSVVVATRS